MTEKNQARGQQAQKVVQYDKLGKGEYELHVLIESTSGLTLDPNASINAKIGVAAMGKAEYTSERPNTGVEQTYWGEHFYLTKQFQSVQQAEVQRLTIAVFDYNRLSARFAKDILLKEPCNVACLAGPHKYGQDLYTNQQKDQNYELSCQQVASISKERKMLIPPEIERKTYQLIFDVAEGKHIIPADGNSVLSFVKVQYGDFSVLHQVKSKDCFPKYNVRLFLPLSLPATVESLAIRLWDLNFIQNHQILGTVLLKLNELENWMQMNKKGKLPVRSPTKELDVNQFRWVNFYGPQIKASYKQNQITQQITPSLATCYVGSVLMRLNIEESLNPKLCSQSFNFKNIDKQPPVFYNITATIAGGLNLYEKNKKYKILIRVGAEEVQTAYAAAKNGFCFWNTKISYTITLSRLQLVPDIFVYLVNQKKIPVCFKRYKPVEGLVQQDEWVMLIPDLAVVNLKRQQAGFLKLKLEMAATSRKDITRTQTFSNPLTGIYESNRKSGKLVIDLICAESLLPLDDEGSIDAFFVFNFMQHEITSSVKEKNLSPIYYQRLVIDTDILDSNSCPPIIVSVFDKDQLSTQFLGSTFIDVDEAIKNGSLVHDPNLNVPEPEPFWYTLTNNNITAGKFLARFRIIPNHTMSIPPIISLTLKKFDMLLVIMGLRGLKNNGLLSIKQPFIQFDFGCFDVIDKTNQMDNDQKNKKIQNTMKTLNIIKTQPKEKGRSININSTIPATVLLPANYKFWPSLSAKVRDNVLGDIYQPTLGYFSINLQNAYNRTEKMKQQFRNKKKILLNNQNKIIERPPRLVGMDDSLLLSIRNFIIKSLNYNWRSVAPDIQKNLNSIKKNPNKKLDEDYIVLFPTYQRKPSQAKRGSSNKQITDQAKYIEKYRDIIMKNGEYMQIGFDDMRKRGAAANTRNKHYRYVLNEPYEKYSQRVNGAMGMMEEIPIHIGRVFTSKDFLSNMARKITKQDTEAGIYKGQLFITEYDQNKLEQNNQFKKQAKNFLNLLIKKGKVHMYLYIIQAANLPPRDNFGHSDPYLVVKAGKQKLSFEKQYVQNEPNPQFLKKIHMILSFPEDSTVDIEVWDYDIIKADELIGSTSIDIQNRVQSKMTDVRFNSPIQTHNLLRETSKRPQGLLRFWLDLVPIQNISLYRQFNINNKTKSKFQVRVIIWSVSQMASNDFQDVNDLYVECNFNGEKQQTDVHFRAIGGQGYFNWRMIFKVQMPIKNPLITFKVFDKDLLNRDDYICSGSFSIDDYLRQAYDTDSSLTLYLGTEDFSKYSEVSTGKKHIINGTQFYDRFEITLMSRTLVQSPSTQNKTTKSGKAQVSIQILTQQQAKRKPNGKGRENPNQHPFLPQPKNRLQFSLNPLTMVGRLCGPKFKKKLACALVVAALLSVAIYFAVAFGGSLVGSIVGTGIAK